MRSRLLVIAAVCVLPATSWPGSPVALAVKASQEPAEPGAIAGLQLRIGAAKANGGYTVSTVPLETYVSRVLAGEAARDSRPAALEALAIAIRTYTLANRGRHRADGFDLCDETHCQVMRAAVAATDRAAAATAGRLLLTDGAIASIYYSASCGGQTEIPSAVWPGASDPSYLPSQPDDGCGGAPVWSAELTAADLLKALRAGGFRGARLSDMRVASRNGSGRVARLRLDGLEPASISGQDFRVVVGRASGWQLIKSTAFELTRSGDVYRFDGHGSGHGVGMCVVGSARLALAGQSADDILHRYYPGLVITGSSSTPLVAVNGAAGEPARATRPRAPARAPVPEPAAARPAAAAPLVPEVVVSLPDGDEGERGVLAEAAARARTDLARILGVSPPRLTLRFHPTVDSYERATKAPWFTSGALVNGEIHLLPPTVLRERGVLERTLRRELVHVMADEALARRPRWVRDGAAIYFAGEEAGREQGTGPDTSRLSCPADAELARPLSAGALTNAYARARSCFARDLAKRKSWRDIK